MPRSRQSQLPPYQPLRPPTPITAAKVVSEIEKHYPLLSYVAREELDLKTGARTAEDLKALVERSKALRKASLDDLGRLIGPAR